MEKDTFRWLMWEQVHFVKCLQLHREDEFKYMELTIAPPPLLDQYMVHGNPFIEPGTEMFDRAMVWLEARVDPHCDDELLHNFLEYWSYLR